MLSKRFIIALLLAFSASAFAADAPEEAVTVQVFVEHDEVRVAAADGRVVRDWWSGQWWDGNQVKLERGQKYRVEGLLGWAVPVSVEADGAVRLGTAEPGERLAHAPQALFQDVEAPQPRVIRVEMPPLYTVRLDVPTVWLTYTVDGVWGRFIGPEEVKLPEGRYGLKGTLGWNVDFTVTPDGVQVTGAERAGATVGAGLRASPFTLQVAEPPAGRAAFHLPPVYGRWRLLAAGNGTIVPDYKRNGTIVPDYKRNGTIVPDYKPVTDEWIGPRSLPLPHGKYLLEGSLGWKIAVTVTAEGLRLDAVEASPWLAEPLPVQVEGSRLTVAPPPVCRLFLSTKNLPDVGLAGIAPSWSLRHALNRGPTQLFLLPPGRYPLDGRGQGLVADLGFVVSHESGVVENGTTVPDYKRPEAYALGLADVNGMKAIQAIAANGRLRATLPEGFAFPNVQWAAFIRRAGTAEAWKPLKWEPPDGALPPLPLRMSGLVALRVCAATGRTPAPDDCDVIAELLLSHPDDDSLVLRVFIPDGRRTFRQGEPLPFGVFANAPWDTFDWPLTLTAESDGTPLILAQTNVMVGGRKTFLWTVDTARLRPGEYTLTARSGETVSPPLAVTIASGVPLSHFRIGSYGDLRGNEYRDLAIHADVGVNFLLNQGMNSACWQGARLTTPLQRSLLDWMSQAPADAVEPFLPPTPQTDFLDRCTGYGMDVMAQLSCAHQFYHYGTCFADPQVRAFVARDAVHMAQSAQDYAGYFGINLGDETGTHRGPRFREDHCPVCRADFQKWAGYSPPDDPRDLKRALAWLTYKQGMHANFWDYVGRRFRSARHTLRVDWQGGNLNFLSVDGGYPPLANQHVTYLTSHWYPHYGSMLWNFVGDALMRLNPPASADMGDRSWSIPHVPLIWSADPPYENTRHEVWAAVMRGVQGVAHFHHPAVVGFADELKADLHPTLLRLGDTLLALRRDVENEVAILFSKTQQFPDCLEANAAGNYAPVYQHVMRCAGALLACQRLGFQAHWISEEQIEAGGLQPGRSAPPPPCGPVSRTRHRQVVLLTGITRLPTRIITILEEFIRRGGVVFVDHDSTVVIEGARRLEVSFGALYEQSQLKWIREGKCVRDDLPALEPTLSTVKAALEPLLPRLAVPSTPRLPVSVLVGGKAKYVFALNDAQEWPEGAETATYRPLDATLRVRIFDSGRSSAVYDLTMGEPVTAKGPLLGKGNFGWLNVPLRLPPGEARLLAVLPERIAGVRLRAMPRARPGEQTTLRVEVVGGNGKPLDAPLPVEVTVRDPTGRERWHIYRTTAFGVCFVLPVLAVNDPPGEWTATARVGAGLRASPPGWTATARFTVVPATARVGAGLRASPPGLAVPQPPVLAFDEKGVREFAKFAVGNGRRAVPIASGVAQDGTSVPDYKRNGTSVSDYKRVLLAIGDGADEAVARPLAAVLSRRGGRTEVKTAGELMLRRFPTHLGEGFGRSFLGVDAARPNWRIEAPLVIIGTPQENALLAALLYEAEIFPAPVTPTYPGPGKGVVGLVRDAFGFDQTTVVAAGSDAAGTAAAVARLAEMWGEEREAIDRGSRVAYNVETARK